MSTTGPVPHIDRSVLPIPPAPFKGTIGLRAKESTPSFPAAVAAPDGAPNVVLILLDDVGFGASTPSAVPSRRRRSRGWPTQGCATTASTPRRCAARPARR